MFKNEIIQHLVFWVLYLLLWSAHDLVYFQDFTSLLITNSYTFLPYVVLVYFNLYVLVPRLLLKKKQGLYLFSLALGILAVTHFSSWNHYYFFNRISEHVPTAKFFISPEGQIALLTEILVLVGFSMTLYLLREWYQKERYAREMEKKRLETELHLLKSQINPHFLFNSLNSIYVMLGKDQEAGREMLLQFSDILSHQLYEASKEKVLLNKELENLENYIRIEKIRHDDLAKVEVKLPDSINGQQIAPMLLLPIVENAFKHGQSSEGYWIKVLLQIRPNDELNFSVENSFVNKPSKSEAGIGLANVKRRLELIYPDQHELKVEKEDDIFKVNLKLQLNDHSLHHSG